MLASKSKTSLWAMAVLFGGLVSLVSPASAKPQQQVQIRGAHIPFAFHIGSHYLPAGKYRLEQWMTGSPSYYLKNVETGKSLMVTCMTGNEERPTQLTFEKDETGYALKKVE
jgi:hypothetical protein